jgi:putative sigma-54 modulation protein
MELQITGKNIEISPEVRQYIERKLDKLGRHLHKIMESKVEISEQKTKSPQQHFVVQVTIDSSGTLFRSQERGENLVSAIDKVVGVMDRQIKRYKGKLYKKGRGSSLARGGLSEEIVEEKTMGRIVKIKQFVVKPMSVDEAIEQMELLGHDFFLFFDADDEGLNLLYRRKDGNYGLIKPELG